MVMGGYSSQSVARSAAGALTAVLLVLVAACSSGSGESGQRPKSTASPMTAPAATIDLSKPIPGGSLHGTPRPPLENTGDDYVAIFKSLVSNLRWLSENPDVALISDLFVPGTPGHDARVPAYQYLTDRGYRFEDEGYHLVSVDVVSVQPDAASLRVVQQLDFERVVDENGQQVGEIKPHGAPEETVVLLAPNNGRWRVASWTSADPTVQI
jgi:hypothetical protein